MPVITDEFRFLNHCEAALWFVVALVALLFAWRQRAERRIAARCVLLAIAMIAFGGSDIAEAQTGAWWRPWWLFAWKAVCVVVFVGLLVEHYTRRTR